MGCRARILSSGAPVQEQETQQIQAAADAGDAQALQQLVEDPAPPSQQRYTLSVQLSSGWAWQPVSCVVYGWLERLAALLYGTNEDTLVVEAAAARRAGRPAPQEVAKAHQQPTAAAAAAASLAASGGGDNAAATAAAEPESAGQAAAGTTPAADADNSSSRCLGDGSSGSGATAARLLPMATSLLLRALQALGPAAEVLRRYVVAWPGWSGHTSSSVIL
jgi:hypothetical protein